MKLDGKRFRPSISVLVSLAVAAMFSLSSFAAPDLSTIVADPLIVQECSGTLTLVKGTFLVNGNPAQTGATILPGSSISVGEDTTAIIDFGPAGKVSFKENSNVVVSCTSNSVSVRPSCGVAKVEVTKGQVTVGAATLSAGQSQTFSSPAEIVGTAGSEFTVDCKPQPGGTGSFIGPGLAGLLALAGVGAAVAIGVAAGDEETGGSVIPPPTSPAQP